MGLKLAIDIGTTNIEYELFGDISKVMCVKNQTSSYGLDVMTRIDKANCGLLNEISSAMRNQLRNDIHNLTDSCSLSDICISANTTMVHLLMGYSCENLGVYPFTPVHTEAITTSAKQLEISDSDIPVYITNGLSAFVGGDIVSGLSTLPATNDTYLFLDLGTNAEMVLYKNDIYYVTSAAAGPAFETHSKGMASKVIDGMSNMLNMGIIDDSGLLCDDYFDNGYTYSSLSFVRQEETDILFTQKKIRDLQMAKSAVKTGIELLLRESNTAPSELSSVYLAGAFGTNLNVYSACNIGLLPEGFQALNITALGNTSLKGAKLHKSFNTGNKKIREIYLNNLSDFDSLFIENLNF